MRQWLRVIAVLVCFAAFTADAAPRFRLKWDNPGRQGFGSTNITVKVDSFSLDPVSIEGKDFVQVRLDGSGFFAPQGFPQLPCINKAVIIPDDRDMKVDVLNSDYSDIAVSGVAPSRGKIYKNQDPGTIPYVFNETYNNDAWYPRTVVALGDPFIHRDFRGVIVQVFPFQYNPVRKILRAYSLVSLKVSAAGLGKANLFKRTHALSGIDAEFSQMYEQNFLNYPKMSYPILAESGGMLIICPAVYTAVMQPLVEWKKKKGMEVAMVDLATAGSTATAIKTYIAKLYNTAGSKLKYVLLVGNASAVPTPSLPSGEFSPPDLASNGADIIYGQIKGTDCYSELLVGRFSGATAAEIKTQVDRSIYYETKMKSTDTWLSNMLLTASNDNTKNEWGESDADFINHEYDTLVKAGFTGSTALRYNQKGVGGTGCLIATASAVTSVINAGISAWNYSDHGSKDGYIAASFYVSNVNALNNTNKYFYTYAVACNSGEFGTSGVCLGEALMKAQKNNQPVGAIGCFMGSINQVWDPPYASVKEALEISLGRYPANKKYTLGGVMINAGMAAYPVYGDVSSRGVVDSYILFGDPSLQIYTTTPKIMAVSHPVKVSRGSQTVKVTGSVDGAMVCLYNTQESIQAVSTISGGSASIAVNPTAVGDTLAVTATLFNYETYQGIIVVGNGVTGAGQSRLPAPLSARYFRGRIYYQVPENSPRGTAAVSVKLYSVNGALAATVVHAAQDGGAHSIAVGKEGGGNFPQGTYIAEIKINGKISVIQVLVK